MGKKRVLSESEIKPRLPDEESEVLGVVEKQLGNDRFMVKCFDGFTRLCRVRGKMKRRVWVRKDDIVILSPWSFQSNTRGDIIYRYRRNQVDWLRSHGYLKDASFQRVG